MELIDFIVIAIILAVVIVSVVIMIKNKQQGKSFCGCDCSHCSGCSNRVKTTEQDQKR